jgi:hypothetical protein
MAPSRCSIRASCRVFARRPRIGGGLLILAMVATALVVAVAFVR